MGMSTNYGPAEDRQEMIEVVSIDRPDIIEAELVEEGSAGEEAASVFLDPRRFVFDESGQSPRQLLALPPRPSS